MKHIPLTRGHVAIVDDEDFDRLSRFRWHFAHGYAARSYRRDGKNTCVYMHREILNAPAGAEVDHINHDGLDNRKGNLRLCERRQNVVHQRAIGGTSPFKGVHFDRGTGRWRAMITVHNRAVHLGRFDREEDAARAYDAAAREHFGAFAMLNFPAEVAA